MMITKANGLLWAKHLSFAFFLSLRAEYVYGISVAIACFVLFTAILWGLFSYNRKTWVIADIHYNECETVILKSLLFSVLIWLYFLAEQDNWLVALFTTAWFHFTFSRLYRGNWEIIRTKPYSDTYRTLKKCWNGMGKK